MKEIAQEKPQEQLNIPQEQNLETPEKKPKKWLVPTLISALVLSLFVAGYFAYRYLQLTETPQEQEKETPTSVFPVSEIDPTANWKTYTNAKYGYTFRYSPEWYLENLTQDEQIGLYYQPDKAKPVGSILIENISSTSYDNQINSNSSMVETLIGSINAKCMTDSQSKTWCLLKNGDYYFSILTIKLDDQEYNALLDKTLSTFKFTNQDTTANWETYTNSENSFSFKYPPDWKVSISPTDYFNIIVGPDTAQEKLFAPLQISIDSATDTGGNSISLTTIQQAQTHYSETFEDSSIKTEYFKVSDKPAVTIAGSLKGPGPGENSQLKYVFIQLTNKVLVLQLGDLEIQNTFERILQTFKFF